MRLYPLQRGSWEGARRAANDWSIGDLWQCLVYKPSAHSKEGRGRRGSRFAFGSKHGSASRWLVNAFVRAPERIYHTVTVPRALPSCRLMTRMVSVCPLRMLTAQTIHRSLRIKDLCLLSKPRHPAEGARVP